MHVTTFVRNRNWKQAVALCALLLALTIYAFGQARQYSFDQNGKPVQVGGPDFTAQPNNAKAQTAQTQQSPAANPQAGQPGQPGSQPPTQSSTPGVSGTPGAPAPVNPPAPQNTNPTPSPNEGSGSGKKTLVILGIVLLLMGICAVVYLIRKGSHTEDEAPPATDPATPPAGAPPAPAAPAAGAGAPPVATPPAAPAIPGPPANLMATPPAPAAPAPAGAAAPAPPVAGTPPATPASTGGSAAVAPPAGGAAPAHRAGRAGHTTSVIIGFVLAGLMAHLFLGIGLPTGMAAEAQDVHLYPGAVAPGHSVNGMLTSNFDLSGLNGCSVALPDAGCSVVRGSVDGHKAMITLSAGPNAMGSASEPIIGDISLTFNGRPSLIFSKKVGIGRTDQLGTLELQHLMAPSTPATRVINNTSYKTEPATLARIAVLEQWRASQSAVVAPPAPYAPQVIYRNPETVAASPSAPASDWQTFSQAQQQAPAANTPAPAGGNVQLAQMQQTLQQIQATQQSQGQRMDGLVRQVGLVQQNVAAVDGKVNQLVTVNKKIVSYVVGDGKHGKDECTRAKSFREAGVNIDLPKGCK